MPRPPKWTDDELRVVVAESASMLQISHRLGLSAGGGTYASLRRHIARLGIDDSHLPKFVDGRPRTRRAWTDDDLRAAVRECSSLAAVMRRLGYVPSGGMHRYFQQQIRALGIDTGHFTGRAWAAGRPPRQGFRRVPLAEVLVARSTYGHTARLRQRLIAEGLKQAQCERCGRCEWEGEPLPLALDHINGDSSDNRLENLRILCPNCHALTDTWCGRNRGRRTPIR